MQAHFRSPLIQLQWQERNSLLKDHRTPHKELSWELGYNLSLFLRLTHFYLQRNRVPVEEIFL